MKRSVCKLLAVLLVLFLLVGCASQSEGPSSPASPSLDASGPEEIENPVGTEEAAVLDTIATVYENLFDGGSYPDEEPVYSGGMMAVGFLRANGLLDPYWDEAGQYWDIPLRVLGEVDELFFSNLNPFSEQQLEMNDWFTDAGLEPRIPLSLVQEDLRRMEDGTIEATYRRVQGDRIFIPVTYRFQPFALEQVPEALKDIYQPGDTFYRFVSVTQREDLLPEPQPKTVEISTADELLSAARRINEGSYGTRYDTYLLTADIDLAGVEWMPMGINGRAVYGYQTWRDPSPRGFEGTFDGQGHTIYNLTITQERGSALLEQSIQDPSALGLGGVGFFYRIGAQGVVKNLRLENADVSLPLSSGEETGSAALLAVECAGRVENVSVQGRVQGFYNVGGLVGSLVAQEGDPGRLENCTADVEAVGWSAVGGLAGAVRNGGLENCAAQGSVTIVDIPGMVGDPIPQGLAGGFIGVCYGGRAVGCGASVTVSAPGGLQSAGFCAYWDGGSAEGCWLDGDKTADWKPVEESPYDPPYPLEIEIRS